MYVYIYNIYNIYNPQIALDREMVTFEGEEITKV